MLKLSFSSKKLQAKPIKTQVFNNTVTKVTFYGTLINNTGICMPDAIKEFIDTYKGVDYICSGDDYIIVATGISKRNKGDIYNGTIGYRIAESKAKIKLYKFMFNLSKKFLKVISPMVSGHSKTNITYGGIPEDIIKYQRFLSKEKKHLNDLIHGINTESSK